MTPTERFLERLTQLLEETTDVLKRTEQLLARALAVRDGIPPDPVQRCALQRYDYKHDKIVCDLEINHRGNHATGGVFWRLSNYYFGSGAMCAAQEPGEQGGKNFCTRPALHELQETDHRFEEKHSGWR